MTLTITSDWAREPRQSASAGAEPVSQPAARMCRRSPAPRRTTEKTVTPILLIVVHLESRTTFTTTGGNLAICHLQVKDEGLGRLPWLRQRTYLRCGRFSMPDGSTQQLASHNLTGSGLVPCYSRKKRAGCGGGCSGRPPRQYRSTAFSIITCTTPRAPHDRRRMKQHHCARRQEWQITRIAIWAASNWGPARTHSEFG